MPLSTERLPASTPSIRDTLFGDRPMTMWPSGDASGEPWDSFAKARKAFESGKTDDAVTIWKKIAAMKGVESRHTLQAWHFLRGAGVPVPATEAKRLLGVVVEVPMDEGLDLLAAYPDGSARYYNYSGAGVVWEHPNDSLDPEINALLSAGNTILQVIGTWDKPRPAAPRAGGLRISLLSPAGLHFGEGPFGTLANDPLAKPAVNAAIALMQKLIQVR